MKRFLCLFLCVLALAGCGLTGGQTAPQEENVYRLYFAVNDLSDAQGGDAIAAETIPLTDIDPLPAREMAQALMEKLLRGPTDAALRSPIPSGTVLRGVELQGQHATVDLSAPYGALSGVRLSIADYCIALTLTQLPEITVVSVTVEGQSLAYRTSQNFTARDVLLSSGGDVVGTVAVTLYFPGNDGKLRGEERTLELYEGDIQARLVIAGLMRGPESKELSPALPEDFTFLSVWTEEGVCYLSLPSSLLQGGLADPEEQWRAVQALVNSLCSLDSVDSVQLLVDGTVWSYFGAVPVGGLLYPDLPQS